MAVHGFWRASQDDPYFLSGIKQDQASLYSLECLCSPLLLLHRLAEGNARPVSAFEIQSKDGE